MRTRTTALALLTASLLGTAACGPGDDKLASGAKDQPAPSASDSAAPAETPSPSPAASMPSLVTEVPATPTAVPPTTPAAKSQPAKPKPAKPKPKPKPAKPKPKPKPPTAALAFSAKTITGARFSGASLAGKPAVLWFWTPWCPTCHGQVPDVKAAAQRFGGKVTVVGVGGLDSAGPLREFVDENKIGSVTHLSDVKGTVWKHFRVTAQGTYVLINASGKVTYRGYLFDDALSEEIAGMIR
jgi:peroxiredoxin